jgi:hypothetical protein
MLLSVVCITIMYIEGWQHPPIAVLSMLQVLCGLLFVEASPFFLNS